MERLWIFAVQSSKQSGVFVWRGLISSPCWWHLVHLVQQCVVGFGAGVGFVVGRVPDGQWLSVAFHWAVCSWKWKALYGSGRFWYFFFVLSNICSQLCSFRGQVPENPKSLHDSSCFQQQLPCAWPNGKWEYCLHSVFSFLIYLLVWWGALDTLVT